eukprot:9164433-Pyramimonas_sp.AAC.1
MGPSGSAGAWAAASGGGPAGRCCGCVAGLALARMACSFRWARNSWMRLILWVTSWGASRTMRLKCCASTRGCQRRSRTPPKAGAGP